MYRHFPTKQMLVAEAFADQLHACRTIVDEGCADPDPWRGLCLVIEKICELHARDRGFTEAFLSTFPGAPDVAAGREYTVKAVAELAQRAKDAGTCAPTSSGRPRSSSSWPTRESTPHRPHPGHGLPTLRRVGDPGVRSLPSARTTTTSGTAAMSVPPDGLSP